MVYEYAYDAFGVEDEPDYHDTNPFRYCGEYFDRESGKYYLRARYYDPKLGRFTQEDTHWNPKNMIYGDDPVKINEWEDRLGLKHYAYAPDKLSVMQSGNLYGYCAGNTLFFVDRNGNNAVAADLRENAFGGAMFLGWLSLVFPKIFKSKGSSLKPEHSSYMSDSTFNYSDRIDVSSSDSYNPSLLYELLYEFKGHIYADLLQAINYDKKYSHDHNLHHIVPRNEPLADEARDILDRYDISINSQLNTVYLSTRLHVHLHTDSYITMVSNIIKEADEIGGEYMVLLALEMMNILLTEINEELGGYYL